jgi:hypothetical protein
VAPAPVDFQRREGRVCILLASTPPVGSCSLWMPTEVYYACPHHADTCDINTLDATEPVLSGRQEAACAADSKRRGRIRIFLASTPPVGSCYLRMPMEVCVSWHLADTCDITTLDATELVLSGR